MLHRQLACLAAIAMGCLAGGNDDGAGSGKLTNAKSQQQLPAYRIGPGDVLAFEVWHEPEATVPAVTVAPDGTVSLPFVGQVSVNGLTLGEVKDIVAVKYGDYYREPQVSVLVKEINSQRIYMIGEVKKEGPLKMEGPTNVLQALAQAGGVSDYAKRKRIYVLRMQNGKQIRFPFDYDAVLRGEKIEQNIQLQPGDTVVVPR